jgi:hypothetical protein
MPLKNYFFRSNLKAIPPTAITMGVVTSMIFLILWDLLEAQAGQNSTSPF